MQDLQSGILSFQRELTEKTPKRERFESAFSRIAPIFGIVRLESGTGPDRIVLFEAPGAGSAGTPQEYIYRGGKGNKKKLHVYPASGSFPEEILPWIEMLTFCCAQYLEHIDYYRLIDRSATTNPLTGLPNGRGFMRTAHQFFDKGTLPEYDAFSFNLKGYGYISKRIGLKNADNLMVIYASELSAFLKNDEIIGHIGGDNYVALIRKERSEDFVRLLAGIPVEIELENETFSTRISATAGIWHIEADRLLDAMDVMSKPGVALSIARNETHDPVCYVTEEIEKEVNRQKQTVELFDEAIDKREFTIYYQPKVDSDTNMLVGAEGLVRWVHEGETVPPGSFVPVLEREGLIMRLDLYVLERVCADLRSWIDEGITPVRISVNVSRRDLSNHSLADDIIRIIEKYDLDRSLLQIEVTETVDEQEHGLLSRFLKHLWDAGISTSIDDFGCGYSSLSTLRNLAINELKIDRSFISNDSFSSSDRIILTDIIHMADELGISVITEGVENKSQLDFVNDAGCHTIQGFYFDRPMQPEEFKEKLSRKQYPG